MKVAASLPRLAQPRAFWSLYPRALRRNVTHSSHPIQQSRGLLQWGRGQTAVELAATSVQATRSLLNIPKEHAQPVPEEYENPSSIPFKWRGDHLLANIENSQAAKTYGKN